jgi:hypothetical protein
MFSQRLKLANSALYDMQHAAALLFALLCVNLNNWVMHPVARVSIKYWKTSVSNTVFIVLDYIVHFSQLYIYIYI